MAKQILKLSKVNDELVTEPLELSPREQEILSQYIKIRNVYFQLHVLEERGDENTAHIRESLKNLYDDFYQLYGRLNKTRNRNIILLDVYGFLILSSVEVKINNEYLPADVLVRSPRGFVEVFKSENVQEALSHCLGIHGRIDMSIISDITGKESDECIRELGDLIYWSPIENCWITADRWLSGNVYSKMIQTRQLLNELDQEIIVEESEEEETMKIPMGKYTQPRPYKNGR